MMDVETFLKETRGSVANLQTEELLGFNLRYRLRMRMGASLKSMRLEKRSIVR